MTFRLSSIALLLTVVCSARDIRAVEPDASEAEAVPRSSRERIVGSWPLETLRRTDGKVFRGLVQAEADDEIEFVEVVRLPGKPWYLVIHYYHPRSVAEIERLSAEQRAQLLRRIEPLLRLKQRARIEAGRMEDVALVERPAAGAAFRWQYEGVWFRLESSADEETTRRSVVRVEQIFRAYEHVLPPQFHDRSKLQIMLHGSLDRYRDDLRRRNLPLENPAIYLSEPNLILAGSDLTQYAQRLNEIRSQNARLLERYDVLNTDFPARLAALREELKQNGFLPDEIKQELTTRRRLWDDEYQMLQRKVAEVNRRNEGKFAVATRQMFERLYHEAFHGYLENYVFPHDRFDVPRWLNEGLAQIFEHCQLDGDTLRIDAPDRLLLARLQEDLTGGDPLPLDQLLATRAEAFWASHGDARQSERHYLYAWGLAYYLTFDRDLLGGDALSRYVARVSANESPAARFEKLVGMPLGDFEPQWRAAMLALEPAPR